jgi:hypothetical protein
MQGNLVRLVSSFRTGKKQWNTLLYLKGPKGPKVAMEIGDYQDRRVKLGPKDRK